MSPDSWALQGSHPGPDREGPVPWAEDVCFLPEAPGRCRGPLTRAKQGAAGILEKAPDAVMKEGLEKEIQ